jgi:hypothetical protein
LGKRVSVNRNPCPGTGSNHCCNVSRVGNASLASNASQQTDVKAGGTSWASSTACQGNGSGAGSGTAGKAGIVAARPVAGAAAIGLEGGATAFGNLTAAAVTADWLGLAGFASFAVAALAAGALAADVLAAGVLAAEGEAAAVEAFVGEAFALATFALEALASETFAAGAFVAVAVGVEDGGTVGGVVGDVVGDESDKARHSEATPIIKATAVAARMRGVDATRR